MKKKNLLIHIPVIHRGYIDLFQKNKEANICLLHEDLIKEFSPASRDIASIDSEMAIKILNNIGFHIAEVVKKKDLKKLNNLILVDDEISRNINEKYLINKKVQFQKVFLRWDKSSVISTTDKTTEISKKVFDVKNMKLAYVEAEKSSDWWRQVGAVLVKNKKIIFSTYNQGVPSDHTPYQVGAIRDFLNVGEKPELSTTIHAEQLIVSRAAKDGVSLKNTDLYVTHFPCSVCAKIIAFSGIKTCFFSEGSSNLEGKNTLESRGVSIRRVKI